MSRLGESLPARTVAGLEGEIVPSFTLARGALLRSTADVVVVWVHCTSDGIVLTEAAREVAEAAGIGLASHLAALGFDGALGSVTTLATSGDVAAGAIAIAGLGSEDELTSDVVRRAGGELARALSRVPRLSVVVPDGLDAAAAAQALVEGIELGAYRYDEFRADDDAPRIESVSVHPAEGMDRREVKRGIADGEVYAAAAVLTRDLVNLPPGHKRPTMLSARVKQELKGTDVKVKVLGEPELTRGGYGGLLGVCRGSEEPPQLVQLTYAPAGATRHVVLVGKGITFDSGGLSLKPPASMMTMKMDMGGAACVLATVKAAAEIGLKLKVTGLMALAENMPSGTAIRPSDVLTMHGGKTVEVLNTDAEGRLVLADALVHGSALKPDAMVDLATLTGAVLVALGDKIGGLMANDDGIADALLAASEATGERLWRLPLPSDLYADHIKSDVADIKNIGKTGQAGTISAGLFLQHFVGEGIPWAHVDIAGLAWADASSGHETKGATGAPVRMLLRWLADQAV